MTTERALTKPAAPAAPPARLFPVDGEPDACDVFVVSGPVAWIFSFSRIVPQYGKLHALTAVDWQPVDPVVARESMELPLAGFSPIHVDWRSGSSVDSFERRVRGYFDRKKELDLPWSQIMQLAVQQLNQFVFSAGDLRPAEWIQNVPPPEYLIYPIWPLSKRPVVWFGQGETAKGTTAVGTTFSASYGTNFAGLRTREASKGFIFVDYEDDFEEFSKRVSRYGAGLDMAPNDRLYHFDPMGRLFVDIVEQLKAKTRAIGGIDGYVIDSAIPACGGDVNKPEPVGAFFTALAQLGKPALIIAHETKEGNDEFPFGSQLWRTMPAMNVNFQGGEQRREGGNLVRDILLRCTKANNVPRFRPLALQVAFTDDEAQGAPGERPVQASTWIRQISPTAVSLDLQGKLPLYQQIAVWLRNNPDASTKDIVAAMEKPRGAVYRALSSNARLFVSEGGGRGRGNEQRWRVIEGGQSEK